MLILIFATLAMASRQVEKFCFSSSSEALKAQGQIEFILIKNQDKTLLEDHCLTVAVASERADLLQRWMRSQYPNATLSFSSSSTPKEECRLKFKKISRSRLNSQEVGLNQQRVNLRAGSQIEEAQDVRIMQALAGKESIIELDRFRLTFTCIYHSSDSYTLKLKGETIPLPPRVTTTSVTPFGVTQTTEAPAQKLEVIESTISLRNNSQVSLGEIFQSLDNKNSNSNLQDPSLSKESGESISQWFVGLY